MNLFKCQHPARYLKHPGPDNQVRIHEKQPPDPDFEVMSIKLDCIKCGTTIFISSARCKGGVSEFLKRGKK